MATDGTVAWNETEYGQIDAAWNKSVKIRTVMPTTELGDALDSYFELRDYVLRNQVIQTWEDTVGVVLPLRTLADTIDLLVGVWEDNQDLVPVSPERVNILFERLQGLLDDTRKGT
jgi:hypothetical protein